MAIVDAYYECQGIAKPMNAEPIANRKKTKTKTNKARALRSVLREL
jgi:hypothetical protein